MKNIERIYFFCNGSSIKESLSQEKFVSGWTPAAGVDKTGSGWKICLVMLKEKRVFLPSYCYAELEFYIYCLYFMTDMDISFNMYASDWAE